MTHDSPDNKTLEKAYKKLLVDIMEARLTVSVQDDPMSHGKKVLIEFPFNGSLHSVVGITDEKLRIGNIVDKFIKDYIKK